MHVGSVVDAHASAFGPLLLPEVQAGLAEGEPFVVLGLVEGEIACGALAGLWLEGAFQILSFYVAPEYRRKSGGRLLIETLVTALTQLGRPANLEIAYTETKAEHGDLTLFLEALGFQMGTEDHPITTVTLAQLGQNPFFKGKPTPFAGALPMAEVPEVTLKNMVRKFQVLEDGAMAEGLLSPTLDKRISVVYQGQDNDTAFVLIDQLEENHICLSMAMAAQPTVLVQLLRMAFSLAMEHHPETTTLTVQAVNSSGMGLLEKLIPQAQVVSRHYRLTQDFEL